MTTEQEQIEQEETELVEETLPSDLISTGPAAKANRYRMDSLERAIVKQLLDDARKPFQAIARELGVDEKTVRNRVAKLRDRGVLSFVPKTNANLLKGCITAVVAVNVRPDMRNDVERVAKEISLLPMVSWVGSVMGHYDIMIEVIVDSWEALTKFELSDLPTIPGVGQTDSFLVLSHFGTRGTSFVDAILRPRQ